MSALDLKGKGALITGGGSGICLSFTQHLYAAECNVLICDLTLHNEAVKWLDKIQASHNNTNKPTIKFCKTDVTDWKQIEIAFEVYEKEFGGVPDVICPGAGVYEPSVNNFWNDRDESSYLILRINLEHPIKLSRIAIRRFLKANKTGVIVLVSSTGAQKSSILTPLYQAAKHGISNFTRCMGTLYELTSQENQNTGIRVVAIAPGPTMSPLMYDHPEALRYVDPDKDNLCEVDEVARAMMAVAFDKDKFPPGTVLEVTHPDRWREVHLLNDPGPEGSGWTSKKDEAIKYLVEDIKKERAGTI